jgi:transposase-like protein
MNKRYKTLDARFPTDLIERDWPVTLTPLQIQFLNAFSIGGSVARACRSVGMTRANPYRWLESSEEFADQFAVAKEYGIQRLEDWALSRAMDQDSPSDRLTEFLLKAARPEVYRDRVDHHLHGKVEHRKRVILEGLEEATVVEPLMLSAPEPEEEE